MMGSGEEEQEKGRSTTRRASTGCPYVIRFLTPLRRTHVATITLYSQIDTLFSHQEKGRVTVSYWRKPAWETSLELIRYLDFWY
jgi:hypothetical protein